MAAEQITTLHSVKEVLIAAPADIVFETVPEPNGPLKEMKLKLEPWPGGRWFRDLGNNTGHLWGHVQVIKPPKLLELILNSRLLIRWSAAVEPDVLVEFEPRLRLRVDG